MINQSRRWSLLTIIPCLLSAVLLLACTPSEPPVLQQGTLLPSAKPIVDFRLLDPKGEPFTLNELQGHWTFAFFGFTHCPDVCPTSLAMLAQVIRKLENNSELDAVPRGLFISVDPQRDTPEALANYLPYFHPDFIGATGDSGEILKLTRQLGIIYAKAQSGNDDNYLVDHSAAIILFDPDGNYHALFNVPHDPEKIASDFVLVKQFYEANR
jgi:protein SCO1/2